MGGSIGGSESGAQSGERGDPATAKGCEREQRFRGRWTKGRASRRRRGQRRGERLVGRDCLPSSLKMAGWLDGCPVPSARSAGGGVRGRRPEISGQPPVFFFGGVARWELGTRNQHQRPTGNWELGIGQTGPGSCQDDDGWTARREGQGNTIIMDGVTTILETKKRREFKPLRIHGKGGGATTDSADVEAHWVW